LNQQSSCRLENQTASGLLLEEADIFLSQITQTNAENYTPLGKL
jgi:hypothetical protein